VLVRGDRLLFLELKSDDGRLRAEQKVWRDRLLAAGAEWYCLRPRDWARVVELLR